MTEHKESPNQVSDRLTSSSSFEYPFAAAPDIIRAHQRDVYFQDILLNHISNIVRRLYGARFLHTYTSEARTFSDLLYLGLTTLIGNRTLGEEYCDIVQIEDDTLKLPEITRRAGYILSAVLVPYCLNRILPAFRIKFRSKLEANLRRLSHQKQHNSFSFRFQEYLLTHLGAITSPSPFYALTLTIFYFTGAYYKLSKRVFGLRYIFTKKVPPSEARAGYEVLGVLLLLQIGVQGWLHLRATFLSHPEPMILASATPRSKNGSVLGEGVEVSLGSNSYSSNNELLFESTVSPSSLGLEKTTHAPILTEHRYHLKNEAQMAWIKGTQQRKCTLCLEELKDPSATQCGHVFCWNCINDWIREKPECPLCRQSTLVQHILPLRG